MMELPTIEWARLTDEDLHYSEGKHDELLRRIRSCTGESREVVGKAIRDA